METIIIISIYFTGIIRFEHEGSPLLSPVDHFAQFLKNDSLAGG